VPAAAPAAVLGDWRKLPALERKLSDLAALSVVRVYLAVQVARLDLAVEAEAVHSGAPPECLTALLQPPRPILVLAVAVAAT